MHTDTAMQPLMTVAAAQAVTNDKQTNTRANLAEDG